MGRHRGYEGAQISQMIKTIINNLSTYTCHKEDSRYCHLLHMEVTEYIMPRAIAFQQFRKSRNQYRMLSLHQGGSRNSFNRASSQMVLVS